MKMLPVRWLGSLWRPVRRIPRPTKAGLVCLTIAVVLGGIGLARGDFAFLLLFGLLIAMLAVSLVLPVLNLSGVTVERLPVPSVHAGEPFYVTALLRYEGRGRDRFSVVLTDGLDGSFTRPGHALALRVGIDPVTLRYRARIKDRGRHVIRDLSLSTRYPLGLFEHRVRRSFETEVLVYPRIGTFRHDPLPFSAFSRRMTSTETVNEKGQEEFRNLREYRMGDNPRLVAWKATARFGELMVREMEDDLTKKVTVFLESRLPEGAKSRDRLRLERAISFTATLLRELARRRYQVVLYCLSPDPTEVSAGRGGRRLARVMEALAVLEPSRTAGISALVRRAPFEAFAASLPVLVLPTLSPRELHGALQNVPARHRPVVFRADGAWERSLFGYHDEAG
jgi:uncharacterized protein (DUF58 family)